MRKKKSKLPVYKIALVLKNWNTTLFLIYIQKMSKRMSIKQ